MLSLRCCYTASTQVIIYSPRPSPPPRPPRPALEWGGEAAGRGGLLHCTGYRWQEQARSVTDRDRAGIDCGGCWRAVRTGGGVAVRPACPATAQPRSPAAATPATTNTTNCPTTTFPFLYTSPHYTKVKLTGKLVGLERYLSSDWRLTTRHNSSRFCCAGALSGLVLRPVPRLSATE